MFTVMFFRSQHTDPHIAQGFALVGAGMILTFQGMQTYVIDAFTTHAASGMPA